MVNIVKIVIPLLFLLTLGASWPAHGEAVSIMTFNVENLFDNTDDPGKRDETYLPKETKTNQLHIEKCHQVKVRRWREECLFWDWSDDVVRQKLKVVGATIRQVNNGLGPDIVALQEVENMHILEQLRDNQLAGLGYDTVVLIEGNDKRGIDVAFLSKFPARNARLHYTRFAVSQANRIGDTRPILEATFELPDGDQLIGLNAHFPAPFHPATMREESYATLNAILDGLPKDQPVFAAGDFNTTSEEDADRAMLATWVRPLWEVAHDLCEECPGTNYYAPKKQWSFLDTVLWRGIDGWKIAGSYLANTAVGQVTRDGKPKRFQMPSASGVSDHWPLVLEVHPPQTVR